LEVAIRYKTDQAVWLEAATTLRAPYWDWAFADPVDKNLPPKELYDTVNCLTLKITTPDKDNADFPNPLLEYRFQRSADFARVTKNKAKTTRYPDALGESDPKQFVE
jgi:hypothetical protein